MWGLNGSSLRSSTDWNTKVRPSGIEVKKLEKKRCEESAATAAAATVAAGTSAAEKVLVGHTCSKVCWQHSLWLWWWREFHPPYRGHERLERCGVIDVHSGKEGSLRGELWGRHFLGGVDTGSCGSHDKNRREQESQYTDGILLHE